jgi:hypothetical protein
LKRRAVKIAVHVEHHGAKRNGAIVTIKIVEIVRCASLIATWRHLEDPALIVGAALRAYAVEVAIGT